MNDIPRLFAALVVLTSALPAHAQNFGSATGGDAATQSGLGGCVYLSSPGTMTNGQQTGLRCDSAGTLLFNDQASEQTTQIVSDTNVTIPGVLLLSGLTITVATSSGGFAMAFDAATVPADGALPAGATKGCWTVPATVAPTPASTLAMANTPLIPKTSVGISVAFSTGADCYHLVKTPAYISVLYQSR